MASEVVIMIGFPGSGKSTYIKRHFACPAYHVVDGDRYKTPKTMVHQASLFVHERSIVFDSTGYSMAKRAAFVQFAEDHGLPVRAVWISTSLEDSQAQNDLRGATGGSHVPESAYLYYATAFEEPCEEEGFLLEIV
jgi:bifunctional polynucleotide phosphatase/kinase